MTTLVVPRNQQYSSGEQGPFFSFLAVNGRTTYRDVFVELPKNVVPLLRELAKTLGVPGTSRMRKEEWVQAITPRIIFE